MSMLAKQNKLSGEAELYYVEDGEKHDAAIHDAILDEGDEAAATSGTKQLMIELGLTEEEALSLLPGHEEEKAALVFAKLRPLEPTREWAKRALKFDPDQPRDETGKWTSGGGGGAAPAAAPAAPEPSMLRPPGRLRGSNPTVERVKAWQQQIEGKLTVAEKEGKIGTNEETSLFQMSNVLGAYATHKEGEEPGRLGPNQSRGFNFQYEAYEGDVEHPNLTAAVATKYDAETRVADITYAGALSNEDLTAVLQDTVIRCEGEGAKRIEDNVFSDDEERIKAYEDAGFNRGDESGGIITMFRGEAVTPEEKAVYERRDREIREKHAAKITNIAGSVAKDLDFNADKISLSNNDGSENFTLNGMEYKAAGLAFTGSADPRYGTIKLFPSQIGTWDEDVPKGLVAHEVKHIKFQNAMDNSRLERDAALSEAAAAGDQLYSSTGGLTPKYAEKYPTFHLMQQKFSGYSPTDFEKTDGVSNYSREYWKQYDMSTTMGHYRSAMHETLAEMAKTKYTTGKFPDHFGPTARGTGIDDKEMDEGAKRWRDLYNAVEEIYQMRRSA